VGFIWYRAEAIDRWNIIVLYFFFVNQRMVPPGKSLMALNGALINIEDLDLCLYVLPYFLDSVVSYFYSLFYLSLAKSALAICFLPWAYQNRLKSVHP